MSSLKLSNKFSECEVIYKLDDDLTIMSKDVNLGLQTNLIISQNNKKYEPLLSEQVLSLEVLQEQNESSS